VKDKIVLITGATNGIGKVAALEIAKKGATVVVVGRNRAKTEATVNEIKTSSGNPHLEMLIGDLSLMADVRRVADEFKRKHDRLDVLINNAGGVFQQRQETSEGLELTFALNHMSYFLLTHLLLDTLRASAPARIVSVASEAQSGGRLNFDDLQSKQQYGMGGFQAYALSKLLNVMFTYELSRRLAGTGVTANVLHPGFVATGFGRNNRGLISIIIGLMSLFALKPEQGADTIIFLATAPSVEGVTGKYWEKRKEIRSQPDSYNESYLRRLWEVSAQIAGVN
jgi:NAD(P)-dependent dehydrogenase (short-subunit alcohol dehydrogenase family)